jgi:nucleotide-binding universal stress UspA family protein
MACGCELIVNGTHGQAGASPLALGSRAEEVLRTSPIPIHLVRDAQEYR